MAEGPAKLILDSLRLFDEKLDRVLADFADLRARLKMIEGGDVTVELVLAGVSGRMDRVDERLARIERRLELVAQQIETDLPH